MKAKSIVKIIIDILMSVGLLALMGYHFWGEVAHEWIGVAMLVLFIAHHILNIKWYGSLFCGRYTPYRAFQTLIDLLVLAAMLGLMISGVILSRYALSFLPITGGMAFARTLHILASYWGYVLMALHLGLHWSMLLTMARRAAKIKTNSTARTVLLTLAAAAVSVYGLYAFIQRDIISSLLLKTQFVFFDFAESRLIFYIDYIAISVMFVFVAHYCSKLLKKIRGSNK